MIEQVLAHSDSPPSKAAESPIVWNSQRLDSLVSNLAKLQPVAKTGIASLDDALGGGLVSGVHILSAEPGTGKSALCLQIADSIAEFSDRRVIYLSAEMNAGSMLARSLSRLSVKLDAEPLGFAEILELASRFDDVANPRVGLLQSAIEHYRQSIAANIAVIDADVSLDEIADLYTKLTANELPPILICDYLQICGLQSQNLSDFQEVTQRMQTLCQLARDFSIPVIAVSSQNRSSARGTANFAALSGSAALEFGATSVMFLTCDNPRPFVRDVRLKIAKSRFGQLADIPLRFYPASSRFEECGTA